MIRTLCMGMADESFDTADRIHTSRFILFFCARVRVFCTVVNVAVWNRYLQAAVWWRRCCRVGRRTTRTYVHIIMHMHMLLRYVRDAGRMRASSCACRTSLLLELRSVPYVCGSGCMLLLNARVSAIRVGRYPVEGESSNELLWVDRPHGTPLIGIEPSKYCCRRLN